MNENVIPMLAAWVFLFPASASAVATADVLIGVAPTASLPSACHVAAGSVAFDTSYDRNASKRGGSALAAYAMVRVPRRLARRGRRHDFGSVSIAHAIAKRVAIDDGLGTSFDPVGNAKARYLSAGLDVK